MAFVIDIEGFRLENDFIVKELALCKVEDFSSSHYTFDPPFRWNILKKKEQKTAKYCEKYLHQIRWSSRGHSIKELAKLIGDTCKKDDIIYVKGGYKRFVLVNILQDEYVVKDMDELACPKMCDLQKESTITVDCKVRHQQQY